MDSLADFLVAHGSATHAFGPLSDALLNLD
jgi:hypothetical protein